MMQFLLNIARLFLCYMKTYIMNMKKNKMNKLLLALNLTWRCFWFISISSFDYKPYQGCHGHYFKNTCIGVMVFFESYSDGLRNVAKYAEYFQEIGQ